MFTINSKDNTDYLFSTNEGYFRNCKISRFLYTFPSTITNVREIIIENIVIPFSYYTIHKGNNNLYIYSYVPETTTGDYYVAPGTYTPSQLATAIQTTLTNGNVAKSCSYQDGRFIFEDGYIQGLIGPMSNDNSVYPNTSNINCSIGFPSTLDASKGYYLSSEVPNTIITIDEAHTTGNIGILSVVVPPGNYTCSQLAAYIQDFIATAEGNSRSIVRYIGYIGKFEMELYVFKGSSIYGALWTVMGYTVPVANNITQAISNVQIYDKYIKMEGSTNVLSIINQDTGPTTLTYTVEEGAFDCETLAQKIDEMSPFTVSYSQTSLKFTITHPTMNFTVLSTSLGGMMGFDANINASLQNGVMTAIAPKTSTLSGTNNILVRSYGISKLMANTNDDTTICSLNVNAIPDTNIVASPGKSIKLQIPNSISSLDFGLTTDDNKALDLNGRNWSITLKFII